MAKSPTNSEELSGAPLGDVIRAVAVAIADGQFQLDRASFRAAEYMSGQVMLRDPETDRLVNENGEETIQPVLIDTRVHFGYDYVDGHRQAKRLSMMELGFTPTFYQFVDTVIDMKLTLRLRKQVDHSVDQSEIRMTEVSGRSPRARSKTVVSSTPMDARYASSYNFSADFTSRVSTKLVPVPPPPLLEQRIRALMEKPDIEADAGELEDREARSLSNQPLDHSGLAGAYFAVADVDLVKEGLTGPFTVEAWIGPDRATSLTGIVGAFEDDGRSRTGWLLGVFDGEFGFELTTLGKAHSTRLLARRPVRSGDWQHVAAVYDGVEMRLYVDGRLCNGSTQQSGLVTYPDPAHLTIGAYPAKSGPMPFAGRLDEVRIWNRALSAQILKRNMAYRLSGTEEGLFGYWRLDRLTNGVLPGLTDRGAAISPTLFQQPQGKTFNTPSDAVDGGYFDLNGRSFTIEFWASKEVDNETMAALSHGEPGLENHGLQIGFSQNNAFTFSIVGSDLETKATFLQRDGWHHWACVFDKDSMRRLIYCDGKVLAMDSPVSHYLGSGRLLIGKDHGNAVFKGKIAEVRVWDFARTAEQIARTMKVSLTGKESGLLVYKPAAQ